MQLSDLQKQSIIDAVKKEFGNELPDEFIELISGGRELSDKEKGSIIEQFFLTPAVDLKYFNKAVERYTKHINSLPEGSEEILFECTDWMLRNEW